ncbi:MAG: SpoIID/LytB domain-containing protein, partial [Candidatus Omnitrophica bacterium]|nr:SpoIID/LytB domain-containing protein [Candidatus Omnitrophota bacterium]
RKIFQIALIIIALVGIFRFFYIPIKIQVDKNNAFFVRVRILHDVNELSISAEKRCNIYDRDSGDLLIRKASIEKHNEVFSESSAIRIGEMVFDSLGVRIVPSQRSELDINGVFYRGSLEILKTEKGFDVINRVELEDYLKGVLPCEVNCLWPFEMLKAQAVASRSFAVFECERRKNENYDVTDDTFSQVYGGHGREKWRTTKAVEVTKNKVLGYRGRVFPAYFHACCGGHTQDIACLWGKHLKPLKGVRCPFCRWTPYFRWQAKISGEEISERLQKYGYPVNNITAIKAGKRDASDRIKYVSIKSHNQWFEIAGEGFRDIIGRKLLKSGNFNVKKYPFFYLFSGYGWGHGVGMCQWGGFSMALRRWKYERILKYYYPDTEIINMKEILLVSQ